MNTNLKILIIDDHPMMVDGYKSLLLSIAYIEPSIITACNCSEAYKIITTSVTPFDFVLLDINLPPFEDEKIFSGEGLATLVRKHWPECKVIILTSHTETLLLFNLIKKINPEGVLIKSDFTPEDFLIAFKTIFDGNTYFTITARQSLKNVYINDNYLDSYNRRIISLLAKGIATKSLPNHLNITISAIDKRKAQIKDMFNIEKGTDEDILREAKKRGLI